MLPEPKPTMYTVEVAYPPNPRDIVQALTSLMVRVGDERPFMLRYTEDWALREKNDGFMEAFKLCRYVAFIAANRQRHPVSA